MTRFNKYGNTSLVVDGIKFPSRKEANYYCELKMLQAGGVVKEFELQVPFELQPKFSYRGKVVRAIKYIADFVVTYKDGHKEVVDVKGFRTKEYMLKKKMFEYKHQDMMFVEV